MTTASQLAVHMKTHDNDGDKFYKCFMCHEAFSSCKSVGEHVKVHAIDGKYYCPQVMVSIQQRFMVGKTSMLI